MRIGLPLATVAVTRAKSRVDSWMIKAAGKLLGVDVVALFGRFVAISLVISQGVAFIAEPISSAIRTLIG